MDLAEIYTIGQPKAVNKCQWNRIIHQNYSLWCATRLAVRPRLFSVHVNDLPEFVKSGILLMCVADTTIYCIGSHVEEVVDKLNKASSELYDWDKKLFLLNTIMSSRFLSCDS